MIVDGSFKDKDWHSHLLTMLRKNYPSYRLGLVYITADAAHIAPRLTKRYAETGRYISLADALFYAKDIEESVGALKQQFDFALWLQNGDKLELQDFKSL